MFRRTVVALALAVASTVLLACSDHKDATTAPPSTTARDGGDAVGGGRDSGDVDGSVGSSVSFEALVRPDALGPKGDLTSAFKVGSKIVVWIRVADEPAGVETSAQFGYAEVRSIDDNGATFAVTGRVPEVLWRRRQRMMPLEKVATTPGAYEVALQGFFTQRITVRAASAPLATTTSTPAPVAGPSDVLGVADLAGVAFGLDEQAGLAALVQHFGAPSFDEQHQSSCGPQRLVGWGSLMVTFGAPSGTTPRVFEAYVFSAPHAGVTEGPADLRTTSGVGPGSSLAELLALEPRTVFVTDQVGYSATTWYAGPGARLAGRLSDDVSAADATVIEIASSSDLVAGTTYPGC